MVTISIVVEIEEAEDCIGVDMTSMSICWYRSGGLRDRGMRVGSILRALSSATWCRSVPNKIRG